MIRPRGGHSNGPYADSLPLSDHFQGSGGHEATDTWLPNAPVSQATGHCHAKFSSSYCALITTGMFLCVHAHRSALLTKQQYYSTSKSSTSSDPQHEDLNFDIRAVGGRGGGLGLGGRGGKGGWVWEGGEGGLVLGGGAAKRGGGRLHTLPRKGGGGRLHALTNMA